MRMVPRKLTPGLALVLLASTMAGPAAAQNSGAQNSLASELVLPTDRSVLPSPEPQYPHSTVFDVRNAMSPPRLAFDYDGGGTGTLLVNGRPVGIGRIEKIQCCSFSADEGADVSADEGPPVTEVYAVPFRFAGQIANVTVELK